MREAGPPQTRRIPHPASRIPFVPTMVPVPNRTHSSVRIVVAVSRPRPAIALGAARRDRKSTRLNSSHLVISYAVFCLKKKKKNDKPAPQPLGDPGSSARRRQAPRERNGKPPRVSRRDYTRDGLPYTRRPCRGASRRDS